MDAAFNDFHYSWNDFRNTINYLLQISLDWFEAFGSQPNTHNCQEDSATRQPSRQESGGRRKQLSIPVSVANPSA